MTTNSSSDAQVREAIALLGRGDAQGAQAILEPIAKSGSAGTLARMGLAYVYRALGETKRMLAEAEAALLDDPRNVRMLLVKAEALLASGDERSAAAFYDAALSLPREPNEPPDLRAELENARRKTEELSAGFSNQLEAAISRSRQDAKSARFDKSIALLKGDAAVYYQQPTRYYLPELPQIEFYDRSDFAWASSVESQTDAIEAELRAILSDRSDLSPYVQSDARTPHLRGSALVDSPDWSAFYLWKDGEIVEANAERCPSIMAALSNVPLSDVSGSMPSVLFSVLEPGAHIPPHHGLVNTRLICHLPLIVPSNCALRVGSQTRAWKRGELVIFDDSIEHEAWNRSEETRVVLLFDIWRPELSDDERKLVRALFSALQ